MPTNQQILKNQHVTFRVSHWLRMDRRRSVDCTIAARLPGRAHDFEDRRRRPRRRDNDSSDRHVCRRNTSSMCARKSPRVVLRRSWILTKLTLADVEAVRFLLAAEREGIILHHCAPFIREWMSQRGEPS